MEKNNIKVIISIIFMYLVSNIFLPFSTVKAAQGKIYRVSGQDKYATAFRVATTNWSKSENVILVSSECYADAISGSVLANKLDAPILFTTSNTLNSDAQRALDLLKPKNIYIIGGNFSISQGIREKLKTKYSLIELGGIDRYKTNIKVADKLIELGVNPSNVLVVNGEGFSDALSAAPIAAIKGEILLLADNNKSSIQPIVEFVKNNNSNVTVIGTKNVINDNIYNVLGATTRIDGGTNRFDTNLKILNAFKNILDFSKVYIASATPSNPDNMYADALTASSLAGKYSSPLVLLDKEPSDDLCDLNATDNAIKFIKNNVTQNFELELIGGKGVISQVTEDAIDEYIIRFPTKNSTN